MSNQDKPQTTENPQEPLIIYEKISKKNEEAVVRKYTRGKVLGKGGFATAYEVTDQELNKTFAAKIVSKASLTKKRALEKLLAEIKIHKSLHHEHIVQFERVFEDKENVYIILEICQNQTLKELLKKRKRIPENECALYLTQTILALKYLHEKKIIHRDLKLGNLLLGDSYNVKVADFGLAAKIEHDGEKRRTICGTPNYIAPEVLDKKIGHSYEVDVWSLGVICYTLLIGKPPFETNDTKATYRRIMKNNYTFPTNVTISEEAKDLIRKILLLDPAMRLTLDEIIQHPFIKNHSSKLEGSSATLKKPQPLKIQSPTANTGLSLPSDRAFHLPTNSQNNLKDTLEKNVYETDVRENLSASAKKNERPTSNSLRPYGTENKIQYLTAPGNDHKANSDIQMQVNDVRDLTGLFEFGTYVTKWIDYSKKYGLGYLLSDGTSGILFNDKTRITISSDESKCEYMRRKNDQQREILSAYSMSNYPEELQKKVLLLKHFKEYLLGGCYINESRDKERELENGDRNGMISLPPLVYVKKWFKTKHAVMLRLSNKLVQVDFEDKTQIIIQPSHQLVQYLNKKGEKSQYPLLSALDVNYPEMVKRLKYTKDMLTYMKQGNGNVGNEINNYDSNKNTEQNDLIQESNTIRDGVSVKLPQMNIYRGMTAVGEIEKERV